MGQKLQGPQLELQAMEILTMALAMLDEAESYAAGALVSGAIDRLRAANGIAEPFPLASTISEFGISAPPL